MANDRGGVIDEAHRRIIEVVQPVLERYGFGVAGGNALRLLGLSNRPTRDVNWFTAEEGSIPAVVPQVEAALRAAGYDVQVYGGHQQQVDWIPDTANYDARWIVTVGERRVMLQVGLRELTHRPAVVSGIAVLNVEDALGTKTLALVDRQDARDFIDVWEAMRRGWTPEQLIGLALQVNPTDYDFDYFTAVRGNLADIEDFEFEKYGMDQQMVKQLRELFEQWPARQP